MKKRLVLKLIYFSLLIIAIITLGFARRDEKSLTGQEPLKFPVTTAGVKAEAFFEAFQKADKEGLEKFFKESLPQEKLKKIPAEERAQRILGLRQELGEIKPVKVISSTAEEITIFVSDQRNDLFRLTLGFENRGKDIFLRMLTIDEAGPEDLVLPLPAMTKARALQGIEQEISRAEAEGRFSGVVLIAKDFQPMFFKAYGLASKEFNVPNQLNTRFNLGSMNKMFTKIAIGQLVEKGKLSLDDKLGKFVPDYPNAEAREKVTVRHLVNMSSGIGDFFGPKFRNTPKDSIRHNHDYLKFFAAEPLAFEPGTKEMYSNGGYVVLGEIISASSGMDYYDYVRKNIFEVAGMKYSDWFEADAVVQNVAEGYTKQIEDEEAQGQEKQTLKGQANEAAQQQEKKPAKKHWRKNIYTRPARGSAAGGGYATAEDLLRFGRALYECRLVGETWTNWVFTNEEPGSTKIDRSRWSLGIAGGAPGINAMLELDGQTGYTVIVLANYDPPVARDIARMAGRYLQAVKR